MRRLIGIGSASFQGAGQMPHEASRRKKAAAFDADVYWAKGALDCEICFASW